MDSSQYINRDILSSLRNISLAKAKIADVMPVSQNMRLPDIRECAIFGSEPFSALMESVIENPDETYTILIDGKPVAMLGTKDIDRNYMLFLRALKQCNIIELLQAEYENIENIVPVDHEKTIQWLQWCGFSFQEIIENHYGYDFFRFNRCNKFKSSIYNEPSRPVMH